MADPQGFSGYTISESQINLAWNLNALNDNVMLVSGDTIDAFDPGPIFHTRYNVGDTITGYTADSRVLYKGILLTYSATGLEPASTYNYKLYSFEVSDDDPIYSDGLELTLSTYAEKISGFYDGKFHGGYFDGDWYGGKWINGFFLSGATWHSSSPRPRQETSGGNAPPNQQ